MLILFLSVEVEGNVTFGEFTSKNSYKCIQREAQIANFVLYYYCTKIFYLWKNYANIDVLTKWTPTNIALTDKRGEPDSVTLPLFVQILSPRSRLLGEYVHQRIVQSRLFYWDCHKSYMADASKIFPRLPLCDKSDKTNFCAKQICKVPGHGCIFDMHTRVRACSCYARMCVCVCEESIWRVSVHT